MIQPPRTTPPATCAPTRRAMLAGLAATPLLATSHAVEAAGAPLTLFARLAGAAPPAGAADLRTSGWDAPGLGAARYLVDPAVDRAFVARHPRAAAILRDGRGVRLAGGAIAVEQLGARGDGVADDRDAIQAALDYAAAAGVRRILFGRRRYSLWCPRRTAPWTVRASEGYPMVVRATVALEGPPGGAVLSFLGPHGGPPDTDVQHIRETPTSGRASFVWRGGGIQLLGDVARTAPLAIEAFEMRDLTLEGNRSHGWNPNGTSPSYIDHAPGEPWDMSDKGLMVSDRYVGDVRLTRCRISNFRGELLYFGGNGTVRSGALVDVEAGGTNGDAFNPGTQCAWQVDRCHFHHAFQAIEGWGGPGSTIRARLSDCYSAGTLWGGFVSAEPGVPFNYPVRGPGPVPYTDVDLVIDRCERFMPGSFIRGRIRARDTQVIVDATLYGAISDVDLDIDYLYDRPGFHGGQALKLLGPADLHERIGTSALVRTPPERCRFRVAVRRSEAARRAGHVPGPGFEWSGSIGPGVSCTVADCGTGAPAPHRSGPARGRDPAVSVARCPGPPR